ncbi:hypothetical protein [Sorangium cellulosum]|uniref:hypothetical protein n=1 Tax=Sorangium cellulosum TaxID=56 RepID=UPI001F45EAA3|nr:hypothetical protein [Sorangium cellulosum]
MPLATARQTLAGAGAAAPGRLAALLDLEPEAIALAAALLRRGVEEATIEASARAARDAGATIARLGVERGLLAPAAGVEESRAPPPLLRAFGADAEVRRSRGEQLSKLRVLLLKGDVLAPDEARWFAVVSRTRPSLADAQVPPFPDRALTGLLEAEANVGEVRPSLELQAAKRASRLGVKARILASEGGRGAVADDDEMERRAIRLLIEEASACYREDRYDGALAVARRALDAAEGRRDLELEIKSRTACARALYMLGDKKAALKESASILALAEDPGRRAEMERADVAWDVANAYRMCAEAGRFLTATPIADLFAALDAGEAYVRRIGRPGWRAGFLKVRSDLLAALGRVEEAIGFAEEGLALMQRDGSGPGPTLACHRWSLGGLLRQQQRFEEAAVHYQAALDAPASSPYDRKVAIQGLARCALARGDAAAGLRHAREAVRLAEGMGDDNLAPALEVLVDAHIAAEDWPSARSAADRMLERARRLRNENRLYFALRAAADVVLGAGDTGRARALLDEAAPLAEALDRQRGGTTGFRDEIEARRKRLA